VVHTARAIHPGEMAVTCRAHKTVVHATSTRYPAAAASGTHISSPPCLFSRFGPRGGKERLDGPDLAPRAQVTPHSFSFLFYFPFSFLFVFI
jgi:hypothetical protein